MTCTENTGEKRPEREIPSSYPESKRKTFNVTAKLSREAGDQRANALRRERKEGVGPRP